MSVSVAQSGSLTIAGVTPTAGTGFTLLAAPALASTGVTYGDYFAETFVINPVTPTTTRAMGDIATGKVIWIQTDRPITVTLTQSAVDKDFLVDSFLYLNATFTAIKLANAHATLGANINMVITGDRVTNPGTPGIY